MKSIIIFDETIREEAESGIYNNITLEALTNEYRINPDSILYYIPLVISGKTYAEKKANLEETAKEWQRSNGDFIDWSYGELATIQSFFEANARRYGLLETFKTEGII